MATGSLFIAMTKGRLQTLTRFAVLIALQVVLSRFFSVKITEVLKFSFGFVPVMLAGALYGAWGGCIVAGVSDVIGALLFPQGRFFIGYTVTAVLTGLIYGLFFHQANSKPSWLRIILAYVLNALLITIGLNTLCIAFQYGYLLPAAHDLSNVPVRFWAFLPKRALEAGVMLPLQFVVTFLLLNRLALAKRLGGRVRSRIDISAPVKPSVWSVALKAAFVSIALSVDLSTLSLKASNQSLTSYLQSQVLTDGLVSASAFALAAVSLWFNPSPRTNVRRASAALVMALLFTLCQAYSNYPLEQPQGALLCVMVCVFLGAYFLFDALCAYVLPLFDKATGAGNDGKALKYAAVIFICALPYLIICRPGTVMPDSYDEIRQFMGTLHPGTVTSRTADMSTFMREGVLINDTQPVMHTVLIGAVYALFSLIGNVNIGITLFVLLQLTLFSLATGRSVRLLAHLGLKKPIVWGITLFYALFPLFPLYEVATLKESAFAIALLGAFTFTGELFACPEESLNNKSTLVFGGLSVLCAGLLRSFGMLIVLPPLACALIYSFKRVGKRALRPMITVCGAVALCACVSFIVYPLVGVGKGPESESRSLMLQQASFAAIEHADELTEDEKLTADKIIPPVTDAFSADPVKYKAMDEVTDWRQFDHVWLKLGLRFPDSYLKATLTMASRYWDVRHNKGLILYAGDYKTYENGFEGETNRSEGVSDVKISNKALKLQGYLKSALRSVSRLPVVSLLFASGTYLFLLIIGALYVTQKRKRGFSLPLMLLVYGALLVLGPISGSSRYAYPIIVCAPFTLALCAVLPEKQQINESK